MATRTATIDYRTTGAERSTAQVISLADALERQKRSSDQAAASADRAAQHVGKVGLVAKTAADDVLRFGNALGPVGIGLAQIAVEGPRAVAALLNTGSAAERASLYHRALNTTILAGTGLMATGAIVAGAYVKHLIEQADAYQSLAAKIRVYTAGAVEAANVQQQLFESARSARQGVEDQGRLFQRLTPALADAGRGPQDAVRVANLVGKALTIQGATGQEATYGAIDLIHALGTGQLQGRQLRGLETEFPVLLRYIAANLQGPNGKVGVAYGALTEMAKKGELSSEKILEALLRAEPQINKDFLEAPKTAQQAWQQLENQILRLVGQGMTVTGTQSGLYNWIQGLADRADKFRQSLLLNPEQLRPLEDGAHMVADAVGGIAHLGEEAVHHFDDIVRIGELVLSLKLGEVMAGWFARTAQAARSSIGDVQAFVRNARFAAGGAAAPTNARAASQLRGVATDLSAQAANKQAEADLRAARAALTRASADRALTLAEVEKAASSRSAAEISAEVAAAEAIAARATAEEAAAAKAAAAAEALKTRATAAATIAAEAEAAVVREVTTAQVAMNLAAQTGGAILSALGGWIGLVSIALGGLAFAWEQSREANQKAREEMEHAVLVGDRMRAITDEITSATWNQIPALQAQAKALRDVAAANLDRLKQFAKDDQAKLSSIDAQLKNPQFKGNPGLILERDQIAARLKAEQAAIAKGELDKASQDIEAAHQEAAVFARNVQHLNELLGRGLNDRGEPLSASDRTRLEQQRTQAKAYAQAEFDAYKALADKESDPQRKKALAAIQDTYSEAAVEATARAAVHFDNAGKPKGRGAIQSALKKALDDLFQEQTFSEGLSGALGGSRYAVRGDHVVDASTGAAFVARSKDEAAAAAKFLETYKLIEKATPAELKKYGGGKSRSDLVQAAEEMLQFKVATSQAAKADESWVELKKRLGLETDDEAKALQAVNKFLAAHAQLSFKDAQEMRARAAIVDRTAQAQKALAAVSPIFNDQFRIANETTGPAKGLSVAAQTARLAQVNQAAIAATQEAIVKKAAEEAEKEPFRTVEIWRQAEDEIAAIRVASAHKVAEETAKIDQDLLRQRLQREQEYAREVEGAFHDLVFGGSFRDFGTRIADDLLEAVYERLIGSPMRKFIQAELDKILTPTGGVSTSGIGSVFADIASFLGFGGSSVSAASITTSADFVSTPADLAAAAAAMGLADGAVKIVRGPGGPRDDRILARLSDGESVINAYATRKYGPLLAAINEDRVPRFADGGFIGASPSTTLTALGLPGSDHSRSFVFAPVVHAQGADKTEVAALRSDMQEMYRQFTTYARDDGKRFVDNAKAAGLRPYQP